MRRHILSPTAAMLQRMREWRAEIGYALLAILVIAIVVTFAATAASFAERFLVGMWVGCPTFLEDSGLSELDIYIGPKESGGVRKGYLVMTDTVGEFVFNGPVELDMRVGYFGAVRALRGTPLRGECRITGAESEIPKKLKFSLSLADGGLTIHDGTQAYVRAFKDGIDSAEAAAAAAAAMAETQ